MLKHGLLKVLYEQFPGGEENRR